MPIVEFDRSPACSLYPRETGESTKCLCVEVVGLCPTNGHFVLLSHLPSFARIKRPRWRPVELNHRHLQSHGKIGDCEQSIVSCSLSSGTPRPDLRMRETNCRGGWNRVGESSFLMYFVLFFPAEPLSQEQI